MTFTQTKAAARSHKIHFIALAVLMIWGLAPLMQQQISEKRLVRDALLLTPFHDVYVTGTDTGQTTIERDGFNYLVPTLRLTGMMTKRRCDFRFLSSYVTTDAGERVRAFVNTSRENDVSPPGNRPPSDIPEPWGVWELVPMRPLLGHPVAYEIHAHHLCPEDNGAVQANLFVRGEWE